MEWDEDFTSEGSVLLACSEREIDVHEYRRVLEQAIAYRDRVRDRLLSGAGKSGR